VCVDEPSGEIVTFDAMFIGNCDPAHGSWRVSCRSCEWEMEGEGPKTEIGVAIESHRRDEHPNSSFRTGDDELGLFS
jgi:hypothetical protein